MHNKKVGEKIAQKKLGQEKDWQFFWAQPHMFGPQKCAWPKKIVGKRKFAIFLNTITKQNKNISVLLSAQAKRFSVSRMQDFECQIQYLQICYIILFCFVAFKYFTFQKRSGKHLITFWNYNKKSDI